MEDDKVYTAADFYTRAELIDLFVGLLERDDLTADGRERCERLLALLRQEEAEEKDAKYKKWFEDSQKAMGISLGEFETTIV